MDRLVDHLFVFEGNAEVRDFPGNYSQYRIWQKENEKKENKWDALEAGKRKGVSTEDIVATKVETTKAPAKKAPAKTAAKKPAAKKAAPKKSPAKKS